MILGLYDQTLGNVTKMARSTPGKVGVTELWLTPTGMEQGGMSHGTPGTHGTIQHQKGLCVQHDRHMS